MAGADAVILLAAAPERLRNGDAYYPYRQDSDFLYLTGISEPNAVLVLFQQDGDSIARLYCRPRDEQKELWDGPMLGLEGAMEEYGLDQAVEVERFEDDLGDLLAGRDQLYLLLGRYPDFDRQVLGKANEMRADHRGPEAPEEIIALDHLLHEQRLVKSRDELRLMRQAGKVSAEAHMAAMRACTPGMNESEIHGVLLQHFHAGGGVASYQPIVGSGANACVLHYVRNRDEMQEGDLLLIDAGAEIDGYAADITRTFPVNGCFSGEQQALYEVVLAAQQAAIDKVRPGQTFTAGQEAAVAVAVQGLIDLELLTGEVDELIESGAYRRFYPHNTSHWLGLDVHDVGDYRIDGHSRELEPGMVLTVEPGIYIRPDDESVDARWRGMGIRIEDDVVVGKKEPKVLSDAVPKAPADIEALMAG